MNKSVIALYLFLLSPCDFVHAAQEIPKYDLSFVDVENPDTCKQIISDRRFLKNVKVDFNQMQEKPRTKLGVVCGEMVLWKKFENYLDKNHDTLLHWTCPDLIARLAADAIIDAIPEDKDLDDPSKWQRLNNLYATCIDEIDAAQTTLQELKAKAPKQKLSQKIASVFAELSSN